MGFKGETPMTMAEEIKAPDHAVTPVGVNHLVLNVRNMEESHHFWCELLGFEQVGELKPRTDGIPSMNMRFYSGVSDNDVSHHDVALVQRDGLNQPPEEWSMFDGDLAVNHIAITYPDREAWLRQVAWLKSQDVKINLRVDHGMTHSIYINDPNGYGVEVLYDLPREVWGHDIDGALNYAKVLDADELVDTTDYTSDF
jgi:catechol 2,3-dioxygenase